MNNKINLIYIMGANRSGTTLLDRLLGQIPGFFSMGEVLPYFDTVVKGGNLCGCGKRSPECEFWKEVFKQCKDNLFLSTAEEFNRDMRPSYFGKRARLFYLPKKSQEMKIKKYSEMIFPFYRAVQKVSGAKFLIDSSKGPWFFEFLLYLQELDIYAVHMVRDPRAVAYSWSKMKKNSFGHLEVRPFHRVIFSWLTTNLRIESIKKSYPKFSFIRYEDFASKPAYALSKLLDECCGDHNFTLDFLSDSTAFLKINHTLSGNPMRGVVGEIKIEPDLKWKNNLSFFKRNFVKATTFPLMKKYGY